MADRAVRRRFVVRCAARFVAFLVSLLITIGGVRQTFAAPFDFAGSDWEGCSELVRLARAEVGDARVVVTSTIDYSQLTVDDGLVVLHPERTLDGDEVAKFMRAGGRLVLLDDFGRGDTILRQFGMERVPAPKEPAEFLRNNPAFALAEPASAHPIVGDLRRVVTNHATGLTHPDLSPVLKIRAREERDDVVIGVAGAVGKGRLLVVSDPSIVMNALLRYAGNKALAQGIVRYAVDQDAWGKRGGRLVLVTGRIEQRGAFGTRASAWDDLTREVAEAVESVRRDGASAAMIYAAAVALGLALLAWVAARAGRLHRPVEPSFVRSLPVVAHGGVAGHAAVLGAPQTSRILAVLELKSALEEQLASLVALTKVPPQTELVEKVSAEGLLDDGGARRLRQVLLRMSTVETMFVLQRSGTKVEPVRDQEVVALASAVRELVTMAKSRRARTHASASEERS